MKSSLVTAMVIMIGSALIYIAGYNAGYIVAKDEWRDMGFQEGWDACEKDATVDWDEWR